jgi:hypothetical protein
VNTVLTCMTEGDAGGRILTFVHLREHGSHLHD